MLSYRDVFEFDDTRIIPPVDPVSDRVYRGVRAPPPARSEASALAEMEASAAEMDAAPDGTLVKRRVQPRSLPQPRSLSQPLSQPLLSPPWRLLRVIADAHQGWVRSIDIDPVTNQWFATGGADAAIKVWDLATLRPKATLTGHVMAVRTLKVSPRFPYLFSGSEDKTVRCWDLERTDSPLGCQIRDYHGHVGGVYAMDLHPELDLLVTAGRDLVVRVWDIRLRTQVMVLSGHRGDVTSVACSALDPQVVLSLADSTVRLWDLRRAATQLTITQHARSIRAMVAHPHEWTICLADTAGCFKQWVLPRGELLHQFGAGGIVNAMVVNAATNELVAGYDDGRLAVYDYVSGSVAQELRLQPVPGARSTAIYAARFDRLGARLVTGEGDKSIKVWGR